MDRRKDRGLRRAMAFVTVAGCLAMVYLTCIYSPITAKFVTELGGTGFHFGLIGGLPLVLIGLQFFGAYTAASLTRRKPLWMGLLIFGRTLYLPAAFLPLLVSDSWYTVCIYVFILCSAASSGLNSFATPMWYSWIADLVPSRILNRYWAERSVYMRYLWGATFLGVAVFARYAEGMSPLAMFPVLAAVGVVAGIVDILLFIWVPEPEHRKTGERHPLEILLEPLRHAEYRSLVGFRCAMSAAMMTAAPFMQVYVLEVLGMSAWQATVMWAMMSFGGILAARTWGHMADIHGQRPVLLSCVMLKPLIVLAFMFVTPSLALPVLSICLFFDSMLNSGYLLSTNGYMLKMAPRENRSMFVAASMALAGISGGLASIIAGYILKYLDGATLTFAGREWTSYHVVFVMSFVFRIMCIPLARRVREPASSSPMVVFEYLRAAWPIRLLMFPVGLYRRARFRTRSERISRSR